MRTGEATRAPDDRVAELERQLHEAREQQTATAEILRVIATSSPDIHRVLAVIAQSARRYCAAEDAAVSLVEGDRLVPLAHEGHQGFSSEELVKGASERLAFPLDRTTVSGRAVIEQRTIEVMDLQAETAEYPRGSAQAREYGYRSIAATPLLRDGRAFGVLFLRRWEVRPFTAHQTQMLRAFADQAVIAIENVRLFNETKEALERQTATAEILRVISASPTDVQPVLDAIAASAMRFCSAEHAIVNLIDGSRIRPVAGHLSVLEPFPLDRSTVTGRSMVDVRTYSIRDLADRVHANEFPLGHAQSLRSGERAIVATPMVREGRSVGGIVLWRSEPVEFTPRQIELVETFASQAVIAIENVRLFNETKEALEQQTATAEILEVISRSAADLAPVFDAIVRKSVQLCHADNAAVMLREEDGGYRSVATFGMTSVEAEGLRAYARARPTIRPGRDTLTGRVLLERRAVHIEDFLADPEFDPLAKRLADDIPGSMERTLLGIPLTRDGEVVGVIIARRRNVRPFDQAEIRLIEAFASQAVIAIENARLFTETKEALARQTAIAEILRVISSSPTDVQPVLDAVAESAVRFCAAEDALVMLERDGELRAAAHAGQVPLAPDMAYPIDRRSMTGHAFMDGVVVQVPDMLTDEVAASYPLGHALARQYGWRSVAIAPLLREGRAIGTLNLRRPEVRPFTDKQIDLLQTFAAQAVIAIENVRLFNETKEALDQQTATSQVLRVIAGSPTEVQPVLDAIAESAARVIGASDAHVYRVDGDRLHQWAHFGPIPGLASGESLPCDRTSVVGRAIVEQRSIHIHDAAQLDPAEYPTSAELQRRWQWRTGVSVPLVRQGVSIGGIAIRRMEVAPFTEKQIQLLETFAQQAVIAIENVRLFNETKEALERQTALAGILRAISESPTDVQPVLDAIAQNAARFCAAEDATVGLIDGTRYAVKAHFGSVPLQSRDEPMSGVVMTDLDDRFVTGRAILERRTVAVPDLQAAKDRYPNGAAVSPTTRAIVATPLLRGDTPIGGIFLRRTTPTPFTPAQISLVETFARQAVIAIENVRLFNETKEALEQQTAVAEVLASLSRSAFDLRTLLQTIIGTAARLTTADEASICLVQRDTMEVAAGHGSHPLVQVGSRQPLDDRTAAGRAVIARSMVHLEDAWQDPTIGRTGPRTRLAIPIIASDGSAVAVLVVARHEARAFNERELSLFRTFADQAAIAIENVRLFNETKVSLEQQTAVAEVLGAISRSVFDLDPVLRTIADRARELCAADLCVVLRVVDDERLQAMVRSARPGEAPEWTRTAPNEVWDRSGSTLASLSTLTLRTEMVDDAATRRDLPQSDPEGRPLPRARLAVPMIREGKAIGTMLLTRWEPRGFSDREVAIVETFASQAAIAMENVRLFNEIKDKSHQLEVASRHKSEFLANMSHELRTPLNAIIGFTDVMLQEMFGPLNEKQKEYLLDVRTSGDHLLTLINDILDLSKIEAGRVDLEIGEFSVADAIENALTLVRERAARHGIRVGSDISDDVGRIEADQRKVKQILVNLLSNAVKFTPDGGWVGITATCDGEHVDVAVRDTGIGIAPEDQARVFEEFQQVGKDPERSREGTGLGLALARRYVELHGGRIWVESELGRGSTFTFTIPVRQTAAVAKG